MNNDPIILTVDTETSHYAFFQMAFGFCDYFLFDKVFSIQGNFEKSGGQFDNSLYNDTKSLFSSDKNESAIVTFSKLKILIKVVDFVAKTLLNNSVDNKMELIYERDLKNDKIDYQQAKDFFFSSATKFFDELKENFSDQPHVLEFIQKLVTWKKKSF
jgi:hypothetical protein